MKIDLGVLPGSEFSPNDSPKEEGNEPLPFNFGQRRPTVTIVIPTLNEAKNLPHVLPQIPEWIDEVILVDGYSKDNTLKVAIELRPDIRIAMQRGRGKGAALRTGFEEATGDIIVMLDADGSANPKELPRFILELLSGADFVKGSRFIQGGGTTDMEFHRKMGNWGLVMLTRLLFGGHYSDLCYGYNAFWASTLPLLELDADGFEIETLMNVRALYCGLHVVEIPSFEAPRIFGTSNLRAIPDGWRVLKTILKEFVRWQGRKMAEKPTEVRTAPAFNYDAAKELLMTEAMHFVMVGSEDMTATQVQNTLDSLRDAFSSVNSTNVNLNVSQKQNQQLVPAPNSDMLRIGSENLPKVPPFYPGLLSAD